MIYCSTRKPVAPWEPTWQFLLILFFCFLCSFSFFFPCPLLLHTLIPLRGLFARPWRALSQIPHESPDCSFSHQACFWNILEEKLLCLGWIKAPPFPHGLLGSSSSRRASHGRDVSSIIPSVSEKGILLP